MKLKFVLVVIGAIVLAIAGLRLSGGSKGEVAISPQLAAAIAKAQSGLPEFRKRMESPRKTDNSFFIRAVIKDKAGNADIVWIKRLAPTDGGFTGVVDETPTKMTGVQQGDPVTVKDADVADWTILSEDKTTEGNFTKGLEPNGH